MQVLMMQIFLHVVVTSPFYLTEKYRKSLRKLPEASTGIGISLGTVNPESMDDWIIENDDTVKESRLQMDTWILKRFGSEELDVHEPWFEIKWLLTTWYVLFSIIC